ncbi:hypothetical protein [Caldilinea sp.]|uniref:hypothetical protein n=1 Tax=Caldilinea sp. TaxID=2293560 RepID=UPI00258E6A71|nr:hypothetical protein [Caldilinea sp.]
MTRTTAPKSAAGLKAATASQPQPMRQRVMRLSNSRTPAPLRVQAVTRNAASSGP